MRGVIFTGFTDFVEYKFGYTLLDELLLKRAYPNEGGFSPAEAYCPSMLVNLVKDLSQITNLETSTIWYESGKYMFEGLHQHFSGIYNNPANPIFSTNVFDFVEKLNVIHFDELKKLYPNADFPRFDIKRYGDIKIVLQYNSRLRLSCFVHGLLEGCIQHFDEKIVIDKSIQNPGSEQEFSIFELVKVE